MSYDLMVFDVSAAPRSQQAFMDWYGKQTKWQESHGYNNPNIPAPALQTWFHEIIRTFPPMNGPLASNDHDDDRVTDYSLGRSVIYAAFAWSEADAAYQLVKELAAKHEVGFFDVSGDEGDIWLPAAGWKFSCEARGDVPLPFDQTFGEVLSKLNSRSNSYFILEQANGNYIQCGGSKEACTVEFRIYDRPNKFHHCVIAHADGSDDSASVKMSGGTVDVRECEMLASLEAAELFELFLAGKKFPKKYKVREKAL
jgi:hypothetical protein